MTKKNVGLAKTQRIRIHPDDRTDLNLIKKEIGLVIGKHNEGDVVHQLIAMYKVKKIGEPSFRVSPKELQVHQGNLQIKQELDELKSLLDERDGQVIRWKQRCELISEKTGISIQEIIELVR